MATVLDTFITKFKFESDRAGLDKVNRSISDFQSKMLKIGASLLGIVSGGALLGHISESVDEMTKFARSVGISVNQLQELQLAAKHTGVPIDSLQSSITNLSARVGEASRGYGIYGEVFARFGFNIRNSDGTIKNAFQSLQELNRVFQGLSKSQQFDLALNAGINTQTIKLLQQTPAAFDAIISKSKELGEFSEKDAKKYEAFQDSFSDLKTSFFELGVQIGDVFIPIFNKLANWIVKVNHYLDVHTDLAKVLTLTISALGVAFVAMGVRAAAAWLLAMAPISPIILLIAGISAAVAAVILVVQDLWVAFKGGKSVIGDFIKNSKIIQTVWGDIKRVVDDVIGAMKAAIGYTKRAYHAATDEYHKVSSGVKSGLHTASTDYHKFSGSVRSGFDRIFHIHHTDNQKLASDNAKAFHIDRSKTIASNASSMITHHHNHTVESSHKVYNLDLGGVTVNTTSNNPQNIANVITDHLKNQFKTSTDYFDSEIAR